MKKLLFVFALSFTSSLISIAAEDVSNEIPASLKTLEDIKERDSYEYESAAHKAAVDTMNSGKEALASFDSSRALKLLSVASKLLPWRGDITNLRATALETYIKVTNSFIDKVDCEEISKRVQYLKQIAPDGILQLKPTNCSTQNEVVKKAESNLIRILEIPEPKLNPTLEKANYTDLSSELSYVIKRNSSFPYQDFQIMHTSFVFDVWKNFSFSCTNFSVDPNTVSDDNFRVNSDCNVDTSYIAPTKDDVLFNKEKIYKTAIDLLDVKNSNRKIQLSKNSTILTTAPLAEAYSEFFGVKDEYWFLDIHDLFIFDIIAETDKGSSVIRQTALSIFGENFNRKSYGISGRISDFSLKNKTNTEIYNSYGLRADSIFNEELKNAIMYPERRESFGMTIPGRLAYFFSSSAEVKGLKKITYRLNLQETYKFNNLFYANRIQLYHLLKKGISRCQNSYSDPVMRSFCEIILKVSSNSWNNSASVTNSTVKRLFWYIQNLGFIQLESPEKNKINPAEEVAEEIKVSPGFDCKKASTVVEKLICSDNEISSLDSQVSKIFKEKLSIAQDRTPYRKSQNDWLKNERDKCLDINCLKTVYQQRLNWLESIK